MSAFPLPFRLHLDAAAISCTALLFSRYCCASVQSEPGQTHEIRCSWPRYSPVHDAWIRSRKYTLIFLGCLGPDISVGLLR